MPESALGIGVEDANLVPGWLIFFDKLQVVWSGLVGVVIFLRLEDHMQTDMEIAHVDGAIQFLNEWPGGEEDDAWVILQILEAGIRQLLSVLWCPVLQREVDIVDQHWSRGFIAHRSSSLRKIDR